MTRNTVIWNDEDDMMVGIRMIMFGMCGAPRLILRFSTSPCACVSYILRTLWEKSDRLSQSKPKLPLLLLNHYV